MSLSAQLANIGVASNEDDKPVRGEWSKRATDALVESWGNKFLQQNRGNLTDLHWKEIEEEVNGQLNESEKKTVIQCQNKVDGLKKRYKKEKIKPGGTYWGYFDRLGELIGAQPKQRAPAPQQPQGGAGGKIVNVHQAPNQRAFREETAALRHGLDNVAQAVREFAVLYERVEAQKAQAVLELEEKRQAFEREMEAIRMQARMQAQAQGYQD